MSYYEQTDTDSILPSYTITDANKVLKVDNNGLFLQWLNETSELPIQTGNTGRYLTTNGTITSWGDISQVPTQTGNANKILTTNGTTATWTDAPTLAVINSASGATSGLKFGSNTGVDGTSTGVNLRVNGVTVASVSSSTITSTGVINITHTGSQTNPSLSFGDRVAGSLSGIYANPTDDNINICTGSTERLRITNTTTTITNNLNVTGDINSSGTISGTINTNGFNYNRSSIWNPPVGSFQTLTYDISTYGYYVQINANNDNQTLFINLPSLNVGPYQNKTFLLTFDLILDNARTNTTALFNYTSPSVRLSTGNRPAQEYTGQLAYEPRAWRLDTPGGALSRRDYRGGPISFLVSTNSFYTWYKSITNDDDFIEDVGSINCIGAGGTGPYSLNVDNTITGRTLYKYNDIIGTPDGSNISLNFGVLSDVDNKFTVYFHLPSSNTTGNFIITNTMTTGNNITIYSGGSVVSLAGGGSTARDGQSLLRCTYYHNRYGTGAHNWVIFVL